MSSLTPGHPEAIDDDFAIDTVRVGLRTLLAPAGEVDLLTSPRIERAARDALDDGVAELWVDLSDVTFIESTGIHVLLDIWQRCSALGRRLAVICPPGPIRRTLGLMRLDEELPMYESRAEAHRAA